MEDINNNEENYEEVTQLDLIYEAHDKVDVLIELLIQKGIITQKEYNNKLEKYYNEMDNH